MGTNTSKATLQQRLRALTTGTQKHFPNGTLSFGAATYTPEQLVQLFKSLDDATTAMDTAHSRWQDALKAQRDVLAKVGPVVRDYRSYLVALYGKSVESLADFGLTPRKAPAPRTAEAKATAAKKAVATREARHTGGKRQKAAIHGTVAPAATGSGSTVSPTAAAAVAAPGGPAPAAAPPKTA
jgi:ABC-type transporter Mla subunit MlaD